MANRNISTTLKAVCIAGVIAAIAIGLVLLAGPPQAPEHCAYVQEGLAECEP